MRVLHVFDHSIPLHSGYTFRSQAILREQRRLGWKTFHVTSPKHRAGRLAEEEIDGLHFYRTPQRAPLPVPLAAVDPLMIIRATAARLEEVATEVRPDVLHAHSPALNGVAALGVARRLGLPLVYEVRAFWEDAAVDHGSCRAWGPRYRATRLLETWLLRRADAVTTICEGLRSEILGRGVPAGKVTVIPNAVDAEAFAGAGEPDEVLKESLGLNGARVLGFIGSFYAYEGLGVLLRALPAVLAEAPDVRVLLVGGGPQEASLRALAQELGLRDRVVFTGRVPHGKVQRYYDLVDVLVYPRVSMRLTELVTPLKPLEALAQGRFVLASDVGGHRELIRDGETGVLFRAGNAEDLAARALEVLGRHADWPAFRAAGRRFVERERTWCSSVARYRDVYGRLLPVEGAA